MKLTIIETGRPPEPIASDFPRYPAMVEALLSPHLPSLKCETVSLVDGQALPPHELVEAILITGSPVGVYDPVSWIEPLKQWIQTAAERAIPQVGICFGHQIMAEAFGGRACKAPQGWGLGRHDYEVSVREPWMDEATSLGLAVSHQDQVLVAPLTARVLARSAFTPHAALIYDHAPALSFQGHPEFCQQFADALIRSRRGTRFPIELADKALETLKQPLDGRLVARWIAAFYQHHSTRHASLLRANAA
jgi:GMP synthase-like glutamine amidotransferase